MNNNILKYYNNTKNIEPHEIVQKVIKDKEKGVAIDIGTGARKRYCSFDKSRMESNCY